MGDEWPDEAYNAAAWHVGLACLELLSDEGRWVHRRVETIDLLRCELVHRQVTVEFTLPEPLHEDLRVGEHGPWCAPIVILRKERLRHFDLREDGKPLPILGADQNGPIATALLEAAVMLVSDPPGTIQVDVSERLGRVAKESGTGAIVAVAELLELGEGSEEVREILEDATAGFFLVTLAESYLLVALLPKPLGRRVLKYSYDQDLDLHFGGLSRSERLAQRVGWKPLLIDIAVPVATRTPSYHAEVVIPE